MSEDGGAVGSGDQAICHVLNYEGNQVTAVWLGSLHSQEWNGGYPAGGPDNNFTLGTKPLGATINADALNYDRGIAVVEEMVLDRED